MSLKITYDEIINNMKAAYFERCGERAEDFSDTSARLEAAASELFSLACAADYSLRQAFPQTATGDYLDFHAELRDISRKAAQTASGELTFGVSEPAEHSIQIPAGTLCSKEGEPFIQFVTDETAVLLQGETEATVNAHALQCGWEYNAPAESVTVMVNPPAGIDYVINRIGFTGGACSESDTALRQRVINSYRVPQSGFSAESIREALLKNDSLRDCKVYYGEDVIEVVVRKGENADMEEITDYIESSLGIAELAGAEITVSESPAESFMLNAEIRVDSADSEAVCRKAREIIADYAANALIDEDIYVTKIVYLLMSVPEISYCEVSSSRTNQGIVICPHAAHLSLSELKVSSYE